MSPIIVPLSLMIAILIGISFVCFKLADNGRKNLAWWIFIIVAMPALSSIFMLLSFNWPDTASQEGILAFIADKAGLVMSAALLSSVGLLFLSERPIGMLVLLFLISNASYISNFEILPFEHADTLPVFFASVGIIVFYFIVESQVKFGNSRKRLRISESIDLGNNTALDESVSILKDANTALNSSLQNEVQFVDSTSTKKLREPQSTMQLMIAYALIGAGIACVIILAFSISGGEQKAYFAILNNPSHLVLPALLGAAMGVGYMLIRGR